MEAGASDQQNVEAFRNFFVIALDHNKKAQHTLLGCFKFEAYKHETEQKLCLRWEFDRI